MENKDKELYKELVAKYSKAYYKKVSSLFELDDLAQEVWLAIVEAENADQFDATQGTAKRTYLIKCIQTHMIKLITREVRSRQAALPSLGDTSEILDEDVYAEELFLNKELADKLEARVTKIKHGSFVLEKLQEGNTVREISELASKNGISLGKSGVHKIVQRIRHEFLIISSEEKSGQKWKKTL